MFGCLFKDIFNLELAEFTDTQQVDLKGHLHTRIEGDFKMSHEDTLKDKLKDKLDTLLLKPLFVLII